MTAEDGAGPIKSSDYEAQFRGERFLAFVWEGLAASTPPSWIPSQHSQHLAMASGLPLCCHKWYIWYQGHLGAWLLAMNM